MMILINILIFYSGCTVAVVFEERQNNEQKAAKWIHASQSKPKSFTISSLTHVQAGDFPPEHSHTITSEKF